VTDVSTREKEVLTLLDEGGDYGDVLHEYEDGEELIESLDDKDLLGSDEKGVKAGVSDKAQEYLNEENSNSWQEKYPELREEEILTLYGTLSETSRSEIADFLDVSEPTVSNYRNTLVEQNYLRNLQPGRGPSDYIPGAEMMENMNYTLGPRFLEDVNPAHPLEDTEEIKWLIGEALYEEIHDDRSITEEVQEAPVEKTGLIDPNPNFQRKESVVRLLKMVGQGDSGFGIISDKIDGAHSIVETLEDEDLVEESKEKAAGIELTEKGQLYLEETEIEEYKSTENRGNRSSSQSSSSTSSSRTVRGESDGGADDNLQELGNKLLEGHKETMEQEEDEKRDFTDVDTEEVDIENDEAGYEGFT
jgi:Mn-dependent DtxR family transcriptional regulator